jgi:spore germination protein YaaH
MSQYRLRLFISALVVALGLAAITPVGSVRAELQHARAGALQSAPAGQRANTTAALSSTNGLSREVFGFAYSSSLADPTVGYPSWDFSLLSTVAFFGLHIYSDGSMAADSDWNVWNSSTLANLVTTAHSKGTKVVLTIVLQDFAPGTPSMCVGLINRARTVGFTVGQVVAKGVDGVNVDYEGLNGTCQNGQTARSMMTDFARQLRAALPAGSYLSVDTYASAASDPLGFFDVHGLSAYVDSFFVMAYDLEYSNYLRSPLSCSSFCLGPTAPLTGYYYNDTSTASQYTAVVPASKVILGVPYYGRKSCVSSTVANAYPTTDVIADSYLDASGEHTSSAVKSGSYVVHRDAHDPTGSERWDTWINTSLGCTRELYWDDTASLGAKYDLVNRDNLRGVGIWTLSYGGSAPELWSALASRFARCSGASLSPATTTQPAGSTIAFAESSTGCRSPQYEFWVQYPDGTWNLKQGWGGASFSWSTTGMAPGVYTVHGWASSSAVTWDSIGTSTVTLTGCTSASVSPSTTRQPIGSAVAFTASSAGCPAPVYEFWVQYPNGTWNLKQGWGAASFSWSTAGMTAGTYTVHAWANQEDAAPTLEVYGASTVTLYSPCVTAAVSPAAPTAPAGSTVALTASSTGCVNPQYEFWVKYPDGTWNLKQGWGAPTFSWITTGMAPGVYTVHAWVNSGGATWDVIGSATVTLSGCSSASLTPATTGQLIGSSIALTAAAAGCTTPVYEFWVLYPDGSWVLKQGWGGPTFTWGTSGVPAGSYTVHAWANQQGAAPTLETYGAGTVTLYSPCSSAALSPSSGTATVGGVGTFTASAKGCPNPTYEFWLLDPAGTWHLMQAFGYGYRWTWNTAGWQKGTYTIHVWADQVGTAATVHEAIGTATFTLK